jgi:hypothetical protein
MKQQLSIRKKNRSLRNVDPKLQMPILVLALAQDKENGANKFLQKPRISTGMERDEEKVHKFYAYLSYLHFRSTICKMP